MQKHQNHEYCQYSVDSEILAYPGQTDVSLISPIPCGGSILPQGTHQTVNNMSRQVLLVKYTDKTFCVFGDTYQCKAILRAEGAIGSQDRINPNTNKQEYGWEISNIGVQRLVNSLEDAKVKVHLNGEQIPTVEQGTRDLMPDPAEVVADQWIQGQIGI